MAGGNVETPPARTGGPLGKQPTAVAVEPRATTDSVRGSKAAATWRAGAGDRCSPNALEEDGPTVCG